MKRHLIVGILALGASACLVRHVQMEIPPPGGCDQCHRVKISGNWELRASPAALGREGGAPEVKDIVLREVQSVPYHQKVPVKKLAVYVAGAPTETFEGEETGVQCFACHESPGPPHEGTRGYHPWGPRGGAK